MESKFKDISKEAKIEMMLLAEKLVDKAKISQLSDCVICGDSMACDKETIFIDIIKIVVNAINASFIKDGVPRNLLRAYLSNCFSLNMFSLTIHAGLSMYPKYKPFSICIGIKDTVLPEYKTGDVASFFDEDADMIIQHSVIKETSHTILTHGVANKGTEIVNKGRVMTIDLGVVDLKDELWLTLTRLMLSEHFIEENLHESIKYTEKDFSIQKENETFSLEEQKEIQEYIDLAKKNYEKLKKEWEKKEANEC